MIILDPCVNANAIRKDDSFCAGSYCAHYMTSPKTSRKKVSHVVAMKPEIEHKIECCDAII